MCVCVYLLQDVGSDLLGKARAYERLVEEHNGAKTEGESAKRQCDLYKKQINKVWNIIVYCKCYSTMIGHVLLSISRTWSRYKCYIVGLVRLFKKSVLVKRGQAIIEPWG